MDNSKDRIMPAIKLLSEVIEKKVNSELKAHDITLAQLRILGLLNTNGKDEISLKELERFFHTAQATIAGIVSRLEDKELITSFYSTDDKRIKKIRLTQKGRELIDRTQCKILDTEKTLTSNFTDAERKELVRLLYKMYDAIK